MSNIESVLHENRLFPPSKEWVAQANVKPADFDALNAKAARDFERAVLQVVRRRRAQRLVQLPRP